MGEHQCWLLLRSQVKRTVEYSDAFTSIKNPGFEKCHHAYSSHIARNSQIEKSNPKNRLGSNAVFLGEQELLPQS